MTELLAAHVVADTSKMRVLSKCLDELEFFARTAGAQIGQVLERDDRCISAGYDQLQSVVAQGELRDAIQDTIIGADMDLII